MGSIYKDRRYVKPKKQLETIMHREVCKYLRNEFPHILFRTDGAGLNLSVTQATLFKSLQKCGGWPDLQILSQQRGFSGLFLELKNENESPYFKKLGADGKRVLLNDPHILNQAATHKILQQAGYCATFAVGLDHAKRIIDWYFNKPQTKTLF